MQFMGEFQHTIDAKGRLSIPAKFRDAFIDGLVVTKGYDNCLVVYTLAEWEKKSEALADADMSQPEIRYLIRQIFSKGSELTLDKLGRILLPLNLRELANLDKEVIISGSVKNLEIWSLADWNNYNNETADYTFNENALIASAKGIKI